ncbi:exodeoxyribonuclease X C-terminal domain-containing protein [Herbaspirillum huttiense]|uniref:Exodeoxyribonuclease X-like C-terminal domain-containing protein n=1 Tax=Herbaspirillum huttiense subsp. lycopersici TaxID=3074428 RepID=A0ABU2EH57_9BURK|nr:hypothetical protein [Herbaspirillum huttiense]MDR9847117.1 hypothetical protein [Herbaspirillum huttiense SE1]
MSGIKNVDLSDTITFGKFKMKTFREVFETNVGYLLWLRDEKIKAGDLDYFSVDFLNELDKAIDKDRNLAKKFIKINMTEEKRAAEGKKAITREEEAQAAALSRETAYAGAWGSF